MGTVVSVSLSKKHEFSKGCEDQITLIEGLGVEGDCHLGEKVQHLSRIAKNPDQPNLRQVHLIHSELFDELAEIDHKVKPGDLGENILTRGISLLDLPQKTRLHIGSDVCLEVTGLRNPCKQIDDFQKGLMHKLIDHDAQGNLIRKAGIMSIVITGGPVHKGDKICIELPEGEHLPLEKV